MKKAKTGAGHAQEVVAGSSSTPYLEDVSSFFIEHMFCLPNFFLPYVVFLSFRVAFSL
jgi:hypothetical protein